MSQHYFPTSYEGRSVTVVVGFDRPLRGFFCFVERNDADEADGEAFVYSNLDDPKLTHCMGMAKTLKHFQKRLADLGFVVPRSMFVEPLLEVLQRRQPVRLARPDGSPRVKPGQVDAIEAGQRVRVDVTRVQWSLPKDGGQLSCHGLRLQRILWTILDATGHRPFVTELRKGEVEIGSSFYGDGMLTLRVPRAAIRTLAG